MNTLAQNTLLATALALLLCACSDPLVGTWEGKEDEQVDLEIEAAESGYEGEGHVYLCSGDDCFLCAFDFDAEESGDDRWDISGHFTGDCSDAGAFDGIECELNDAGDELACEIPGAGTFEYEKKE